MKKVLITGAFGFLGKATAKKFSQEGWEVFGIGRGEPHTQIKNSIFGSCISAEITLTNLNAFGVYPDVIIHCAGGSSVSKARINPTEDHNSTIVSIQSTLEFIRKFSINTRLVFISSAAVYGNLHNSPISEIENPKPISAYGRHKLKAENLCQEYVENYQLKISIIRFFSLYGPDLKKQLLWDAANKAIKGQNIFFGSGAEMRDFLYISDAVELIYMLGNSASKKLEIFNGGSGMPVSTKEVIECIFQELGINLTPEFSNKINPGDPRYLVSNNMRLNELNWSPKVKLTQGLRNYVEWFCDLANLS